MSQHLGEYLLLLRQSGTVIYLATVKLGIGSVYKIFSECDPSFVQCKKLLESNFYQSIITGIGHSSGNNRNNSNDNSVAQMGN